MSRPVRIGQTGDLHVAVGPRFADTVRCIDYVIDDGAKQGVELWLVGGDLTGNTVPHESYIQERNYIDTVIQRMAEQAPVVIVRGNHDEIADVEGYGRLAGKHQIILVTKPEAFVTINTASGQVAIFCLPYPDKATLIDVGFGSIKDDNRQAADALRDQLRSWKKGARGSVPTILVAHLTIAGCELAGGEVLADKEVELFRDDLVEFDADWAALSHIHKRQMLTPKAAYAGSPNAQDFGAIDEKGYLIVDVAAGAEPIVHHRLTPSRKMVTVAATWSPSTDGVYDWQVDGTEIPAGAEVRVKVLIPEGQRATCPTDQIEALMRLKGAHAVHVAPSIVPTNRVRSPEIGNARSTADRLTAYWNSLGENAPSQEVRTSCLELLPEIEPDSRSSAGEDRADALIVKHLRCKGAGFALPDEVAIDFDSMDDGIIAFIGGNGAGKSHLLELAGAATWFGEYLYYDCKFIDHVPRDVRDAFSELVWESAGHTYRALIKADPRFGGSKSKGKTEGFLWRDGEALNPSGKMTDYTAAIEQCVPDLRLLRASAVSPQGGRGSLFDLPKAEKKDMFIKMLGLEHLQVASKAAADRAATLETALEALRAQMAADDRDVARAAELRASIAKAEAELGMSRALIAQLDEEVVTAQTAVTTARENLARAQVAASTRADERTRIAQDITEATLRKDDLIADRDATNAVVTERDAIEAADCERNELDEQIGVHRSIEDAWRADLDPLDAEHATKSARLGTLQSDARVVMRDLEVARAAAAEEQKNATLNSELATAQQAVLDADTEISALEEEVVNLEAAEKDEAAAAAKRSALDARIAALEPRTELVAKIKLDEPMCAACPLTEDARQAVSTIERLRAELAALPSAPTTPATPQPLRIAIRAKRAARDELQATVTTLTAKAAGLAATKESAAKVPDLEQRLAALSAEGVPLKAEVVGLESRRAELQTLIRAEAEARILKEARRAEILPIASRITELAGADAKIEQLNAAIDREEQAVDALSARLAALPDDAEVIESHRLAVTAADTGLAKKKAARDEHAAVVREQEGAQARQSGELNALGEPEVALVTKRLEEAATVALITAWRLLERGLGRDGAQALCLDQAGPVISEICNELLRECFDSRFSIDIITALPKADGSGLKEVFEVNILDAENGSIDKGCGGEMVLVNEGLRLAICIYNCRTSGYQIRTLYRDEAMDGLSEFNQDRYVAMLRRAQQLGGFRKILITSHSRRVWNQADHHVFVSRANAERPARLFVDEEDAWIAWEQSVGTAAPVASQDNIAA